MANIKHVGQLHTGKRCVVVFREVPEEPNNCLVIDTDALPDWMHDDVINAVESPGAQESANFYEYAQRVMFTDGSNMLQALHKRGLMQKVPTGDVLMTPNNSVSIKLNELNDIINEQNGGTPVVVPEEDPNSLKVANKQLDTVNEVVDTMPVMENATDNMASDTMDDLALARSLMDQAITFQKEADDLKERAIAIDPSLKPKRGRPVKNTA